MPGTLLTTRSRRPDDCRHGAGTSPGETVGIPEQGDQREARLDGMGKGAQATAIEATAGIDRISRPVIDPDDPAEALYRDEPFAAIRPDVARRAGSIGRSGGGGLKRLASQQPDRMIGLLAHA